MTAEPVHPAASLSRRRQRPSLAQALYVLVCAAVASATHASEENALAKEPYGYFRPAAKLPKAFADVAELHLSGAGEYGAQATPPYFGMLKTKGRAAKSFRIRDRTIEGRNIQFTTEAIAGRSYRFSGMLARLDFHDGGVPIDEVMLSGTLTRLHDGKPTASVKIGFFFEAGG